MKAGRHVAFNMQMFGRAMAGMSCLPKGRVDEVCGRREEARWGKPGQEVGEQSQQQELAECGGTGGRWPRVPAGETPKGKWLWRKRQL